MKIFSRNEWDPLKTVVVGSATNANWPINDPVFSEEKNKTTWTETAVPSGAVPEWIVEKTNQELDILSDTLYNLGVEVWRPDPIDFVTRDGMYNYCPRDRLLIADDVVVDPAMMYPCREMEIEELNFVCQSASRTVRMPRNQGMIMDAANVCRLGDDWLFLRSASGNDAAVNWLRKQFPNKNIEVCDFYSGVHIDSTVVPLQEGLVLLNGARVNEENIPNCLKSWERIYVNHMEERDFYQYPFASKWIGMNCLVVKPGLVIMDQMQTMLIDVLTNRGIEVIPLELTHSRTLGGGFHCVTLDIHRES